MGAHSDGRLNPSFPFTNICLDLFGPFEVRDCFRKCTRRKINAVIYTCLFSRAVHLDVVTDCSTEDFLQTFRRFVALRGYPEVVHSDSGTQLVGAVTRELQDDETRCPGKGIQRQGSQMGICSWLCAMATSVCGILDQFGEEMFVLRNRKSSFDFNRASHPILFETAILLNDRPIGRHPSHPNDGFYLSPNSLLLGRSMNQPVPFRLTKDQKMSRYNSVECTLNAFWKKWQLSFLPQMAYYKKWKIQHPNIQPGDIVLLEDQNAIRGLWKLGIVKNVYPGRDTLIRDVEVEVV